MAQNNEGLLATSPAKIPRLRRKLQKCVTKQQASITSRFVFGVPSPAAATKARDTTDDKSAPGAKPRPSSTTTRNNKQTVLSQRERGLYEHEQPLESLERVRPQTYIIPELSHLVNTSPQPQLPPGADLANPPMPKMRRRAKTPILSIGQLEDIPRPGNALGRTSSVDLIAEQYQAILESRRSSVYSENFFEHSPSTDDSDTDAPVTLRRRRSSGCHQDEFRLRHSPRTVELANPSPASDDGTLVSFQEETVYFKPVSFSAGLESPLPLLSRQTNPDDNVSLQICLDLLTRELSSAIGGRPQRSSVGPAGLQVLLMIEAYERLRDQMAELSQSNEQARSMEMMFDMWLRALYSIHDSMTGGGKVEDDDYEVALGTEELD